MTGRELILSVLNNEQVDRVPVAPFIHVNFVNEFFDSDKIDAAEKTVEVYERFGFDIIHRNCTPAYNDISGIKSDDWQVEQKTEKHGRDQKIYTTVRTPGGDLSEVFQVSWMSKYDAECSAVDFIIKSEKDFELFQKYQPGVGKIDTALISRAIKSLGKKGIVAPWVQGAFNFVAIFFRKLDDLIMDAMLNEGFYNEMIEYFMDRNKQIIDQFIDAGCEVLSYAGNIASGKLIGPDFFERNVMPYEKKLIDYIHSRGCKVIYHNCGYASKLLGSLGQLGMDMYESLTPAPFGDTKLDEALRIMPSDVTLSGNLDQIEFLKTAQPDEIARKVRQILEKVRQRGNFILATTDYFGEQTPYENIEAFSRAGREYGKY